MGFGAGALSGGGHTLADWLALHGLSRFAAAAAAQTAVREGAALGRGDRTNDAVWPHDGPTTWRLAAEALARRAPSLAKWAQAAQDKTLLKLDWPDAGKAATITDPDSDRVIVVMAFRADARSALALAHEFGHAAHAFALAGRFSPPVVREACAFLSELAFAGNAAPGDPLAEALRRSRRRALLTQGRALLDALNGDDPPYAYGWNYPLARLIADASATDPEQAYHPDAAARALIETALGAPLPD